MEKRIVLTLAGIIFLSGCFSSQNPPTPTPDACIGWDCRITGSIYNADTTTENAIAAMPVVFRQISWCSPTAGTYQTITDADGSFSFDVFLHDTDSFVITVESPDFQPSITKFGGFDCLSCHCPPFEIILVENR